MKKLLEISIEEYGPLTKIENKSKYLTLVISEVPIPPKRKYRDIMILRPRDHLIYEYELDFTKISMRWEER